MFRQPHFWLSDLHAAQTYPAIEERAKTAHTVEWCDVWFYQRIASGRRCSCHALGATPYMGCPVCYMVGIPGGYIKWGTVQAVVDVTLPGLVMTGIRRADTKSAGSMVLALEDGVLDGMAIATVELGGGAAEAVDFVQWDEDGGNIAWDFQTPAMFPADTWDALTVANLTRRLGDAVQIVRIRLRLHRASTSSPGPLVARAFVRTRRAPEDQTCVKISRPRIQHQLALAELGVSDDWQVQRWWADATLPRITDEDWFYEVSAKRAWKVIDIDRHAPQNHTLAYDFSLRKVQDGEAILRYPP